MAVLAGMACLLGSPSLSLLALASPVLLFTIQPFHTSQPAVTNTFKPGHWVCYLLCFSLVGLGMVWAWVWVWVWVFDLLSQALVFTDVYHHF